jgi:RND family efflux transporter MFP subunit
MPASRTLMDSEKLRALQIKPEARRRPQRSFWMIFVGVALLTAVGAFYAWPKKDEERRFLPGQSDKAAQAQSTNRSPSTVAVTSAPPPASGAVLTVSGYIITRERIELSPRFIGVVNWIGVKKGDTVKKDQVVVRLDDAEQRARVIEAEGRLANAKVAVNKAELDYARIKKLIADKIETPQTEDDARLRVESARATVQEAEGALALAKTYLDWTVIRSPIDGVVLEKLVDAGELVTPQSFGGARGPSTAFLAMADPKDLQVEVELNEVDLSKVFLNQKCRVSPEAYPDKTYEGRVTEIAPEANRQKGTLQVKVQVQEPDRFMTPELSAKVEFLGPKT